MQAYDESLLQFGVQLSYEIMSKLEVPSEWRSTVLSQRDVPGIPRNAIKALLKNGIRAISVGANGSLRMLKLPV